MLCCMSCYMYIMMPPYTFALWHDMLRLVLFGVQSCVTGLTGMDVHFKPYFTQGYFLVFSLAGQRMVQK